MHALTLRNAAQAFLEASWSASAVDSSLAQAAMVSTLWIIVVSSSKRRGVSHTIKLIAIFESSAHPAHTGERACASLLYLDQIIRTLALTQVDINDPHASTLQTNPSLPSRDRSDAISSSRSTVIVRRPSIPRISTSGACPLRGRAASAGTRLGRRKRSSAKRLAALLGRPFACGRAHGALRCVPQRAPRPLPMPTGQRKRVPLKLAFFWVAHKYNMSSTPSFSRARSRP